MGAGRLERRFEGIDVMVCWVRVGGVVCLFWFEGGGSRLMGDRLAICLLLFCGGWSRSDAAFGRLRCFSLLLRRVSRCHCRFFLDGCCSLLALL